jgi:hypothetical protein
VHGRDGHAPFFNTAILKALSETLALPWTLSWFYSLRGGEHSQFPASRIADSIQRKTPSSEPEGVLLSS